MVFPNRLDDILLRSAGHLGRKRVQAPADLPAVIASLHDDVDFSVKVLAHVAGPQGSSFAVEGHAPNFAKAIIADF
jgi:hypothetical protein